MAHIQSSKSDQKKVTIVLFFLGCLLIAASCVDYYFSFETLKYSQVKGHLKEFRKETPPRGSSYYILQYSYCVNGIEYINNKFSNGKGNIEDLKTIYNSDKIINEFYDNKNPNKSVLVKGGRESFINGIVIIGIMLMLISIISFLSIRFAIFSEIWLSMFG